MKNQTEKEIVEWASHIVTNDPAIHLLSVIKPAHSKWWGFLGIKMVYSVTSDFSEILKEVMGVAPEFKGLTLNPFKVKKTDIELCQTLIYTDSIWQIMDKVWNNEITRKKMIDQMQEQTLIRIVTSILKNEDDKVVGFKATVFVFTENCFVISETLIKV